MKKELIIRMSSNWIVIPWKAPEVFLDYIFFCQSWNFRILFAIFLYCWCICFPFSGSVRNVQGLSKLLLTEDEHEKAFKFSSIS